MKSNCCNAEMKEVGTPDFIGSDEVCTVHWECQKCKQPCDPEIDFSKGPQKPWNFNIEGMIKASNKLNMTKHNKTVEERYRQSEKLLNDFKNKRITYTEAIEEIENMAQAAKAEAREEERRRTLHLIKTSIGATQMGVSKKTVKYIDLRSPKGWCVVIMATTIEEMLEKEKKNGWIVDKIIDTERGDFYVLTKAQ